MKLNLPPDATLRPRLGYAPLAALALMSLSACRASGQFTDAEVRDATRTASAAWIQAFNAGDAAAAAALYEDDAVMVAAPFGTFEGRAAIQESWEGLIAQGFDDAQYQNTRLTVLDSTSARIESDWTMNNAHGVITNELWVLQPDGRALLREDHFEVASDE